MNYGYFDDKNKTYVITNPKTPTKWINYIGGLSFGGFIDQTGGSIICKGDPALNRIIKYMPQKPISSFNGETCYIRIKRQDDYLIFSPFLTPTMDDYEKYECHVGMGYNTYISIFHGIQTEVTVFVPHEGNCEIRDYKITNLTDETLTIDVIPIVEYTHFDALKQYTNADWVPQTMRAEILRDDKENTTLLQYAFMRKGKEVNYFTSNYPVSSFETDRKTFLGDGGYGSFAAPKSLQKKDFGNGVALRGDHIAALMHHLGKLQPKETKRIATQLGQLNDVSMVLTNISYYRDFNNIDLAFKQLNQYWDHFLAFQVVNTPNKAMNSMINVFNPRQCHTTLNWSRYLSLYQLGLGARGIGFRDSAQDVMSMVGQNSEESKTLIIKLLKVQKYDGSAMHQFNPKTMIASTGESDSFEDRYPFYGDDHLWIILSVTAYLKETGDMAFLDEIIPYYEKDKYEKPKYFESVLDHLRRALAFTKQHVGIHGLPLLGFADWNDTVNLPKGSESVFIANLYGKALQEMIELFIFLNQNEEAQMYRNNYEQMKDLVDQYAWDGNWYLRYFNAEGFPLGSHSNKHGNIYANAQSWTVISGFSTKERALKALDSLNQYLNTTKGVKLSYPGYSQYDITIGGVTSYPPGAKENGGIFLHANPWVMIAETMVGHGNQAFSYYEQINPATKNDSIDEYECEPYVYPQNILGNEHPQFGLARNSWLSGTASWAYQAATQYILGIKPTYEGLQINPCIPKEWDTFTVIRRFRNDTYQIEVMNSAHVEKGVKHIIVDKRKITGNIIPLMQDGKHHHVLVTMG